MILDRLTVRGRVSLLPAIPLLVVVLLNIPLLAARFDEARAAQAASNAADAVGRVSALIEMVQRARLLSVAFMSASGIAPNALTIQLQEIDLRRAELIATEEIAAIPDLHQALDRLQLNDVGARVLAGRGAVLQTVDDYGGIVDGLIDALALTETRQAGHGAPALEALDALLRSDEAASRRTAMLLLAATSSVNRDQALTSARELGVLKDVTAAQFRRIAGPADVELFRIVDSGPTANRLSQAETTLTRAGSRPAATVLAAEVLAAGQAQTEIRQLVESRIARAAADRADDEFRATRWAMGGLAAVGVGILAIVVMLSTVVGRSVTRPLRRLTVAAGQVADLAQEELLRVADEDAQEVRVPHLAAIDVRGEDEIGDLAAAFNRVQATAALLLERQVVSRRNVAAMFASMGRRTSNLVGRQLALIDSLERAEEDPGTLATLYRLDHAATRLRRNASSLVVLSGGTENLGEGQPMPLGDVVRAALGTVEGYQRVTLDRLPALWVEPGAVGDLSLLLAELLDNALSFSPPRTRVEVVGTNTADDGCTISVVDHGMGMPLARLAEENGRLRRRERLDLAPSDVLGLFVIGRIARRHGIHVRLEPTPGTGITAIVTLPATILVEGPAAAAPGVPSGSRAGITDRQLAALAGREGTSAPPAPGPPVEAEDAAAGALPQRVRGANWTPEPVAPQPSVTPLRDDDLVRRIPGKVLNSFDRSFVPSSEYRARIEAAAVRAIDADQVRAEPDGPDTDPSPPLVRRVRGASLTTQPEGLSLPTSGSRGCGPGTGSIALVPERPEDVLSWAIDLEAAMSRLPDPQDERSDTEGTEGADE